MIESAGKTHRTPVSVSPRGEFCSLRRPAAQVRNYNAVGSKRTDPAGAVQQVTTCSRRQRFLQRQNLPNCGVFPQTNGHVDRTAAQLAKPLQIVILTFVPAQFENSSARFIDMTAVSDVFQATVAQSRMAFMPFVTAGDPDTETTAAVLLALRDAKVDLVELGFPYSDPIADGPVIQASYTRALLNGITVEKIFAMMTGLKGQGLPPVLAMVSFAIIFRHGNSRFIREAAEAGFSGLIIPDLPADEAEEILAAAKASGLDLVQLIAPTTTARRTSQILEASTGFLYCISVAGTTGVRRDLPPELLDQLRSLRTQSSLPLAVGFGISGPEHVANLDSVADGVIVGSAMVRRIAEAGSPAVAASAAGEFAREMATAAAAAKPSLR